MMQRCTTPRRIPCINSTPRRHYALSLHTPKGYQGAVDPNRERKSLKGYQYALYESVLKSHTETPVLIFTHDTFTPNRLITLRQDIIAASARLDKNKPLRVEGAKPVSVPIPGAKEGEPQSKMEIPTRPRQIPTLLFAKSSVLGVCLRNMPSFGQSPENMALLEDMTRNITHGYALLSFHAPFDPQQLLQTIKAMERSVPPRPPRPQEEIDKEEAARKADPPYPGRRIKRQRLLKTPDMRLIGGILGDQVMLTPSVKQLGTLPTLETLREQLVGLLSQPGMQLTAILNEAAGAKLSRTLEGLKKSLEEDESTGSS